MRPWLRLSPIPIFILAQYFGLLRRFESSNLWEFLRSNSAWYMHLQYYRPLLLTLYQHQALPESWRRPWWSDDVALWFYFNIGDTMPRYCESEDGANKSVRILCSQPPTPTLTFPIDPSSPTVTIPLSPTLAPHYVLQELLVHLAVASMYRLYTTSPSRSQSRAITTASVASLMVEKSALQLTDLTMPGWSKILWDEDGA